MFLLQDCSWLLVLFSIEINGGMECSRWSLLFRVAWFESITELVLSCDLLVCITNKWPMNLQCASPCLLPLPQGDRERLVLAANEAEMGKFCCSLSVWIPFTELPGSKSNCCTFLYGDEEGDVEIGRSMSPAYVQPRLLGFISLDIMLCSRQMFAT